MSWRSSRAPTAPTSSLARAWPIRSSAWAATTSCSAAAETMTYAAATATTHFTARRVTIVSPGAAAVTSWPVAVGSTPPIRRRLGLGHGRSRAGVAFGALGGDALASIENVTGGSGDDLITGDWFGNLLLGLAGADQIDGAGGNDTIRGGSESDTIDGGLGDDRLWGDSGSDTLNDAAGSDSVHGGSEGDVIDVWSGHDWIYGDSGDDRISVQVLTTTRSVVSATTNSSYPIGLMAPMSAPEQPSGRYPSTAGCGPAPTSNLLLGGDDGLSASHGAACCSEARGATADRRRRRSSA